jgi:hypothetical protein
VYYWRIKEAEDGIRVGEVRIAYRFLVENLKQRDHLMDVEVDGRMVLKWRALVNTIIGLQFP